MAPVNVDLLSTIYEKANFAMSQGMRAVISAALNACGIPDPGLVGWVVEKVLGVLGFDPERAALAIAISLEYAKRTGSLRKGLKLKNHCSICSLKGHNRSNHSDELDEWLCANGLASAGEEVGGFLEAAGLAD